MFSYKCSIRKTINNVRIFKALFLILMPDFAEETMTNKNPGIDN